MENIFLIENHVEVPEVYPARKRSMYLEVLFVGRAGEEKRPGLIAEAARLCAKEKVPIRFRFVGDLQGVIPPSLRKYCDFKGVVSDANILASLYQAADVLVLASSREGFPMVIMEAMAHGVVPVSTAVGGIPFHITDGKNGLLIQATDEKDIVTAIVQLLKRLTGNLLELETLSRNAHDYAKAHFNSNDFFVRYRSLLLSTSDETTAPTS